MVPGDLVRQGVEPATFDGLGFRPYAFVVKDEISLLTLGPLLGKTVVLMDRHLELTGEPTPPVVFSVDAVRIETLDSLNQVLAHQVSAVVRAAVSPQVAVLERDRLQFFEQRDPDRAGTRGLPGGRKPCRGEQCDPNDRQTGQTEQVHKPDSLNRVSGTAAAVLLLNC